MAATSNPHYQDSTSSTQPNVFAWNEGTCNFSKSQWSRILPKRWTPSSWTCRQLTISSSNHVVLLEIQHLQFQVWTTKALLHLLLPDIIPKEAFSYAGSWNSILSLVSRYIFCDSKSSSTYSQPVVVAPGVGAPKGDGVHFNVGGHETFQVNAAASDNSCYYWSVLCFPCMRQEHQQQGMILP